MDEEVLISKLKSGDRDAFNELLRRFSGKVLNTCYRFLLDKEDAEDISQEVFVEVYKSIRSFRADAGLSTWIYRIAVTKSLDELKKRKRKKRITTIGRIFHLDHLAHMITGGNRPDTALHEKERMTAVQEALNGLPDNQRVAFTLSKIEGYSNPEIAEIMNVTVMSVESLIKRAKKKVTDELKITLKDWE